MFPQARSDGRLNRGGSRAPVAPAMLAQRDQTGHYRREFEIFQRSVKKRSRTQK